MISCMLKKQPNSQFVSGHHVELLKGGSNYFQSIEKIIDDAKESIHLYAYIINNDQTGSRVIEKLIHAAERGVKVFMMADGYASRNLPQTIIRAIQKSGIQFRFFNPILSLPYVYMGRRMHHKVIVTDNKHAIVGGINIADRYNDMPEHKAWLDYALWLNGPAVDELSIYCQSMWNEHRKIMNSQPQTHHSESKESAENSKVRIRSNDWLFRKNEITQTYEEMFAMAKKEIIILCSYFIPGRKMRKMMAAATARGVKVLVITAGYSDVPVTKYAERWLYDWMFRNQICVYEYQHNILHGKVAICDEEWLTIGSYNINNISAYASIELNVDVKNHVMASMLRKQFMEIMKEDCLSITPEGLKKETGKMRQLLMWFSYQFIRVTLNLFTFFFPRKN